MSKDRIKYQSNVNDYRKNYKSQFTVRKNDWRPIVTSDIIDEMFCFLYYFQFNSVYLILCGLPYGVGGIRLKWTLRIKYTDLVFSMIEILSYDPEERDCQLSIDELQEKEDLYQDMEEMIFLSDIEILCEYDLNGNVISGIDEIKIEDEWDQFIEEEKQEKNKKNVQDQDQNLSVSVGDVNNNNDDYDDDYDYNYRKEMVRLWMKDQVQLMQYFNILVANGYDNMDAISTLNLRHLETMGIKKMGHRHQIMRHVEQLKYVYIPIMVERELDEMRKEIKQIKSELSDNHNYIWTLLTNLRYFFDGGSV